jgi:hypothetical protein
MMTFYDVIMTFHIIMTFGFAMTSWLCQDMVPFYDTRHDTP